MYTERVIFIIFAPVFSNTNMLQPKSLALFPAPSLIFLRPRESSVAALVYRAGSPGPQHLVDQITILFQGRFHSQVKRSRTLWSLPLPDLPPRHPPAFCLWKILIKD